MTITEHNYQQTNGQWCGTAAGYNVYYSESSSINITLNVLKLFQAQQVFTDNFAFKITYKFLKRIDAKLRYVLYPQYKFNIFILAFNSSVFLSLTITYTLLQLSISLSLSYMVMTFFVKFIAQISAIHFVRPTVRNMRPIFWQCDQMREYKGTTNKVNKKKILTATPLCTRD